ncbi:hypothetical protein H9L10_01505 [Phycicoccus endophyticus]|uniref:Uncharacterized protein n=1 Tax=Phycicoccus endophyticus TaxID=1690220 RepID=A0A7G9R2H4_9MICO|nr:hypothetical protein [Phycicoccus endophyticus]NHI20744.1 hypothetical protein [Phycicoccus endophyticus]QNN49799.1 hypothetical protein H9L10_01505 [Phycicoccus endophyticus]GGL35240.1 hypothetical protein GCM10012283_17090 [Phycicoccus endophyticus]
MSTPTAPMADPRAADVHAYILAVRSWLGDLPAEDVDELTFGMEADLAERAAEGGGRLGEVLGEPEEYAAELRAAAGLPPRATAPRPPGHVAELRRDLERLRAGILERWAWLPELRATWWIARGFTLGWVLLAMAGTRHPVFAGVVGAVLSYGVGRASRGWRSGPLPGVVLLANLVAAVAVAPVLWVATHPQLTYVETESSSVTGLARDGEPVLDLFVYDADGHRVDRARILDQSGQGVFVDPSFFDLSGEEVPRKPDGSPDVETDVFPLVVGDQDPWAAGEDGWTPPLVLAPLPVEPGPAPTPSEPERSAAASTPSP